MAMTVDESRRSKLLGLASLALAATVPGCGGGGGGGSGAGSGTAASLRALELTTPITTVPPGQSVTLGATARLSDGTGTPVASTVTWQSSNPAAATVNSEGRVTAVEVGSTTITATYQSATAALTLRVGETLIGLDLLPPPFQLALALGGSWQLLTEGRAGTNTTDVKAQALWSSSDPSVATVGQGAEGGLVRGIGPGIATISCTLDGYTASTRILVLAHQRIARAENDTLAMECVTGIDNSGRALAVWSSRFRSGGRPDLAWSQYREGTGWSAPASLRPLPVAPDARSMSLKLSMQDNGAAWLAWVQPDGLFAARYDPVAGWAAPVQVVEGSRAMIVSYVHPLGLQVDVRGNALLVWLAVSDSVTTQFWSSTLDGASGRWTPAEVIPNSQVGGILRWWQLATNPQGDATLLWARMEMSPIASDGSLLAMRWQPAAAGQPGRWLPRETVLAGTGLPFDMACCMDDAGVTLVGWIQPTGRSTTTGRGIDTLMTRRHLPGQGWERERVLLEETDLAPNQLALAAAAGQGAGAIWANGWNSDVLAARMAPDGNWRVLGEASNNNNNPAAIVGDPFQLEMQQLADGRMVCTWIADDNFIGGALATRVHHPVTGWAPLRRDTAPGRLGQLQFMSVAFNANGVGAVSWQDSNQGSTDFFGHAGWQP